MTYDSKPFEQFISQLSKLPVISNKLSVNKGFSLIELLVTFTLISIISGIGFASFVSYSRRQVVNQAAGNLKETIDLARFSAVSFVKPKFLSDGTPLCSDTDQLSSYKINFCLNNSCPPGADYDYEMVVVCSGNQNIVRTRKLPDNVSATNVNGSPKCTTITFNVLSNSIQGNPCSIYVEGYGNQFHV